LVLGIVKPIARGAQVLVITLSAMICIALLDRIPDAPAVLEKRTLDTAKAYSAEAPQNAARGTFCYGIVRPLTRISILPVSLVRVPPAFDSLTRWRTAADSSPPAEAVQA
jgi:hypothetical protein